jgi:hypothetical protein
MKKAFVIPADVVPNEEQLKELEIYHIYVIGGFKAYERPIMVIEFDTFNNRASLKKKEKIPFIGKEKRIIKGSNKIIEALKDIKEGNFMRE